MDRREFLKMSGWVALLSLGQISGVERMLGMPAEVEHQGKLYRGTKDGLILYSGNGGKDWQVHTKLGSHLSVLRFFHGVDGKLYSQVGLGADQFKMALTKDGKFWRTVAG